jgi:hypothetical protein
MKYIKAYKIFESFLNKGFGEVFKSNFGISRDEIKDLLVDVDDDFEDIDWWIEDAKSSWLVKPNNDIFVIYFESNKLNWEKENLYDLEHFLHKGKLYHIKSYLKDYGLEVYAADFGEVDTQYEIVVHKKGTPIIKTEEYRKRYLHDKHSEYTAKKKG